MNYTRPNSTDSFKRLSERIALAARPWVVVVGSGLSSGSIASWSELQESIETSFYDRAVEDESKIDYYANLEEKLKKSVWYWDKFSVLKDAVPVEYRNIIRQELEKSESLEIPPIYTQLWSMNMKGILSLNLDSFVRRASSLAHDSDGIKKISGKEAGKLQYLLGGSHRFLYELHGNSHDESSWVFTRDELNSLYASDGYTSFLETVFTQFHVIFLGVSADDIAIGSALKWLANKGIQGPEHFWITDRTDDEARKWADFAKVERTLYPPGAHHYVSSMLRRLHNAQAEEPRPNPVVRSQSKPNYILDSPAQLVTQSIEEIRDKLNSHINALISQGKTTDGHIAGFAEFVSDYDEAFDRAWYTPSDPAGHQLFGYTLQERAATGAFGEVFRATDPYGNVKAIKLLKREIRRDSSMLQAFRRGVQAMSILEKRDIPGMVHYEDASEVPSFVTMEWIEGPTLKEAKERRLLQEWEDILDVFLKVTRVILSGHKLPEVVLHRDIRPTNIMIRGGWINSGQHDVVVLDFDLATYVGATSKSVLAEGSALGYLAPEQVLGKGNSRSALVDAFGLGMTLYYLAGGTEPEQFIQRSEKFANRVRSATRTPEQATYLATARRVERIIIGATQEDQKERWSVGLIEFEVSRLLSAVKGELAPLPGDLAAEEIAAQSQMLEPRYTWNSQTDQAEYTSHTGFAIRLSAGAQERSVRLWFSWSNDGSRNRSRIGQFISEADSAVKRAFKSAGWENVNSHKENGGMQLDAEAPISESTDYASLGRAVDAIFKAFESPS